MASVDQLKTLVSSKLGYASANQFQVTLPTDFSGRGAGGILNTITSLVTNPIGALTGAGGGEEMNILCNRVSLPGRQVLTTDRTIGMERQQMAYGYAVGEVSMTFYVMNDYGVKKYFDQWYSMTVPDRTGKANYKVNYAKSVKIHQLRKPLKNIGLDVGPIDFNIGLGGGAVYTVELVDAFPKTIQAIELSNDLDGLVQLTVDLSYTNHYTSGGGPGLVSISGGLGSLFG